MAPQIEIVETSKGHIMMDGEHHILFLYKKDSANTYRGMHTLYLERAENPTINDFENRFEKSYFTEADYDWWEEEEVFIEL